ncbi:MAG: cupin domain-containing protein [Leptolyngbyaceae cyanobacterium MO_188.B28]|nr:cupin domain-containing protein [Leptolyngbyaceae cyanobacterium MO_188.B28]
MKSYAIALITLLAVSCAAPNQPKRSETQVVDSEFSPPPGSNQMLRAPITIADGLEVIISDVVIPPNATVPRHYHPGEEFLYVLEGAAVHVEEGKPDRILKAGDAYVIPPRAEHAPRGGAEGARAVVFRVHVEGAEERILVE